MSVENIAVQEAAPLTRKSGKIKRIILVVAIISAAVALGVQHIRQEQKNSALLDTSTFYSGIRVQGVELGGKSMQQAKDTIQKLESSLKDPCRIEIRYGDQSWVLTQEDFHYQFDTDSVLEEAYQYGRTGSRKQRYQQVQALKTEPKEWQLKKTLDEQSLNNKLDDIAAQAEREPEEPGVSSFDFSTGNFVFYDGKNGLDVDAGRLKEDVKALLDNGSGSGTVELSVQTIPFSQSLSGLKAHMKKLGTFSTVSKNSAAGTYNMAKALTGVNGVTVEPGETFSFLGTVGACDQAHGYKQAGAILNGQLIQEYGGGICQASTTLYGAALRSNMEIVERYNHTIPSSYVAIGQDATVSYPSVDFKFKNPTDYPVYLVTQTKNKVLTATLYGYQPDDYDSIKVTSQVTETISAPTQAQYTEDASLSKGTVRLSSKARAGYKASAQRVFYKNGAEVRTEKLFSSYYKPQPAYYAYGKGTDLSKAEIPKSDSGSSSAVSSQESSEQASSESPSSQSESSGTQSSSGKPDGETSSLGNEVPVVNDDVTGEGEPEA